jgi:hypothetical protein
MWSDWEENFLLFERKKVSLVAVQKQIIECHCFGDINNLNDDFYDESFFIVVEYVQ